MKIEVVEKPQTVNDYPLTWEEVRETEGIYCYRGMPESRLVVVGHGDDAHQLWLHMSSDRSLLPGNKYSGPGASVSSYRRNVAHRCAG